MNKKITILLADHYEVVREGLRALLGRTGFIVVGDAGEGLQALHLAGPIF